MAAGERLSVPEPQALTDSVEEGLRLPLPLAHSVPLCVVLPEGQGVGLELREPEAHALCEGVVLRVPDAQ